MYDLRRGSTPLLRIAAHPGQPVAAACALCCSWLSVALQVGSIMFQRSKSNKSSSSRSSKVLLATQWHFAAAVVTVAVVAGCFDCGCCGRLRALLHQQQPHPQHQLLLLHLHQSQQHNLSAHQLRCFIACLSEVMYSPGAMNTATSFTSGSP